MKSSTKLERLSFLVAVLSLLASEYVVGLVSKLLNMKLAVILKVIGYAALLYTIWFVIHEVYKARKLREDYERMNRIWLVAHLLDNIRFENLKTNIGQYDLNNERARLKERIKANVDLKHLDDNEIGELLNAFYSDPSTKLNYK